MSGLVKKRDLYTAEQAKKSPKPAANSFDRAVSEPLSAQIRR
jgi:hypothetical protein